ncbi:hypothetical protein [Methylicorpusculum sp.]|jgi:hypothetical protein|uniref:hypothetical protein n=1 Tax=Methylicorpusculum sp. TaxID=2713644 RepID=UPI002ABB27AA|nr:hypothetical protein [Methylicorpusculum sp.]MDZ4150890.1 hypothetical protein [Methylicorpusculum sp.]
MVDYQLIFPDDFDDYSWEVESKGWFNGAIAIFEGVHYSVVFYDPIRLAQEIEDELKETPAFFENNLIVVNVVNRRHMEKAIEVIAHTEKYKDMVVLSGRDGVYSLRSKRF